ncbi:MAG: RagB/SusD family nutrient uptake outer membrane protein [Cyclobacteriaceae bacterium]|nr:RagB/SusD family nutrient uptake outer membrane protein [Cyclobacteriaceae bacterium]
MKIMNRNKFYYGILAIALVLGPVACKDQLDVGNPNAPTLDANVITEAGLAQYAMGATYINGFRDGSNWLGNSYFSLPWGYSEIMADNLGASASNNQITTIGIPEYIILDDATKILNTGSSNVGILRTYNSRAATGAGNNALYFQWLHMYALNAAQNSVLGRVDKIPFTGDKASKVNTIKAWCYWWKGYAYASIGSMYIGGLIVDDALLGSNVYVTKEQIIARSDFYYNLAITTLNAVTVDADYTSVLNKLIPEVCKVGKGGVLSRDEWKRNINTMLARNILVSKLAPFVNSNPNATITGSNMTAMTAADWNAIKTLTTDGVKDNDKIFTARSSGTNSLFGAASGNVAAQSSALPSSSTFKVGERLVQYFKPADKRFTDNFFVAAAPYKGDYTYTTKWAITQGGSGTPGVYVYASPAAGAYEVVMAASYEENALMLAEANIRLGGATNIDAGTTLISSVRTYLGAALPALAGGLTQVQALSELVAERRVALVFRGLSFYDNRRWGWTYKIANGGGSYGNKLTYQDNDNFNVTISYDFMDFWDVPADELVLNPPGAGSAPVKNEKF